MYVCFEDGRELRVSRNGVYAEQLYDGSRIQDNGYKVWATDLWCCPECGFELLVTSSQAIAGNWQEDYSRWAERAEATFYT